MTRIDNLNFYKQRQFKIINLHFYFFIFIFPYLLSLLLNLFLYNFQTFFTLHYVRTYIHTYTLHRVQICYLLLKKKVIDSMCGMEYLMKFRYLFVLYLFYYKWFSLDRTYYSICSTIYNNTHTHQERNMPLLKHIVSVVIPCVSTLRSEWKTRKPN